MEADMDASVMIDVSMGDEDGFDPATLANLAALSSIINDDDEPLSGEQTQEEARGETEEPLDTGGSREPLTREQVQDLMNQLAQRDKGKDKEDDARRRGAESQATSERGQSRADDGDEGEEGPDTMDDEEYGEYGEEDRNEKGKRKRNRTVLSCTECHRRKQHCDRNIPCSRCVKRGIPSMCQMEHPVLPQRKRKRPAAEDEALSHELVICAQSLETLLRGTDSYLDTNSTHAAVEVTIRDASRAAKAGSTEATNALQQLAQPLEGMNKEEQSKMLFEVLQLLAAASTGKALNAGVMGGDQRGLELWASVPSAAPETTVAVASAFAANEAPTKVNISLFGYRDVGGKLFIPPTVRYAAKQIQNEQLLLVEPLSIDGYAPFLDAGVKFAYGADSYPYRHKRIAAVQAVSLTGALRLAASFIASLPNPTPASSPRPIFIPTPTSHEDYNTLKSSGLDIRSFRFLDPRTGGVDWESLREDLSAAPVRSAVLLYVSGSMPSGAELSTTQWRLIASILAAIMAFQGLSSGDTTRDAQALRFMVHEGLPVVLLQNFDTTMGLYADSPSIVSIVVRSPQDKAKVEGQLRSVARGMWAHVSPWGARIAEQILTDAKLHPAWLNEIGKMNKRLISARGKIFQILTDKLKTPGDWEHIKKGTGMYCTALLPPKQAHALTAKHNIHLLPRACFNLACLDMPSIDLLTRSIDSVVRAGIREAEEAHAQRLAAELAAQAAKEQAAREEAEREQQREEAEREKARQEDTLLMERSIVQAMERQKQEEEEEKRKEVQRRRDEEMARQRREREEIARQAEAILATIQR
ncbi:hypothetical protein L198_03038 [Cryptococcus wingfieldii CBS 7118]|uniref:Zn(2)-C6 fungal-type domain-containing protein n=1 Tax=Cryptococcus wingfieldii CBS 7118 TaxID=1295528 RepID=A0A1E3JLA3_9TREE|nr:hypothetical protein L198_03038 [Cryptococcus wingfieldii CBS 7118]ODO00712.1 hypothetical protein L198_03038 [Cryptococcus wingfieldii CBS 7118]